MLWDAFKRLAEKLFCVVENDSFQITEAPEILEALTCFLDSDGIAYAELGILLTCFEEVYRIQKKGLSRIEGEITFMCAPLFSSEIIYGLFLVIWQSR